jgi:peroxiredoxin
MRASILSGGIYRQSPAARAALGNASQNLGGALASGPVLLAFFKVACPTCQLTLPFIERMFKGVKNGATRMFAVSQDDAEATREDRDGKDSSHGRLLREVT